VVDPTPSTCRNSHTDRRREGLQSDDAQARARTTRLDRFDLGPASNEEAQEILQRVKFLSLERKDLLDEDDFREIADDVLSPRQAVDTKDNRRQQRGRAAVMTVLLTEAYKRRSVTTRGVQQVGDWRLKVYGISYGAHEPGTELVKAALAVAETNLPRPAQASTRYGVGFLGIHEGRSCNFVFLDWWEDETDLRHNVFLSTLDEPTQLRPSSADEPAACVWDIAVLAHERSAWIKHVLANQEEPDLDSYLADTLSGPI